MISTEATFQNLQFQPVKEASDEASLKFEALLKIDPSWSYFEGHFPDFPVLPAVAIVDASLFAICQYTARDWSLVKLNGKFLQPTLPGENVRICITKRNLETTHSSAMNEIFNVQWISSMNKTLAILELHTK